MPLSLPYGTVEILSIYLVLKIINKQGKLLMRNFEFLAARLSCGQPWLAKILPLDRREEGDTYETLGELTSLWGMHACPCVV